MPVDRRALVASGLAAATLWPAAALAQRARRKETRDAIVPARNIATPDSGLVADSDADQSRALQVVIDRAAERGGLVTLPAGRVLAREIRLRPRVSIRGQPGRSVLALAGPGRLLTAHAAHGARLSGLTLDGLGQAQPNADRVGLLTAENTRDLVVEDLTVVRSGAHGVMLAGCQGRITTCRISTIGGAGIFSIDGGGVEITGNHLSDCGNNGILVWRSKPGEDGTIVSGNRVERIRADNGGSGQNGNGVNVYRAGNVIVSGNRITDCAFTAVRGNAASNIQISSNSCSRLGEVALYAEFGFEGAVISNNLVDAAATGISVTNFNEGGRLAVVQGNLIRNLVRREHEPEDKRGEGIAVEADSIVIGNTIENAPTAGIVMGWGRYMRDVSATANILRNTRVGIMITRDPAAGAALIAQNMISGAKEGGVRLMDKGVLTGPDLVRQPSTNSRIVVTGNVLAEASG
jgi:uncharacterized secreted repeat protein (TIGR03808 family)